MQRRRLTAIFRTLASPFLAHPKNITHYFLRLILADFGRFFKGYFIIVVKFTTIKTKKHSAQYDGVFSWSRIVDTTGYFGRELN